MGVYYIAVNETKKEFIHAHRVGGGLKMGEYIGGKGGDVVMWALFHGWNGDTIRMVADTGDEYDTIQDTYKDVSRPMADAIRDRWKGWYRDYKEF